MSKMEGKCDYEFKLALLGDSGVGKSSLLYRIADNLFPERHSPTIQADFMLHTVHVDSKTIRLQIWDTAGHERFKSVTSSYYRGSDGIFVVYDVTNQQSFDNVQNWIRDIEQNNTQKVKMLLLGNKHDLITKKVVDYVTAKEYADQLGIHIFETSAKSPTNVNEALIALVSDILRTMPVVSLIQRKAEEKVNIESPHFARCGACRRRY